MPSNALLFKALKYLTGSHARDLQAKTSSGDTGINANSNYVNDNQYANSFGFISKQETDLGDGTLEDFLFISGPQHIQSSYFVNEAQKSGNTWTENLNPQAKFYENTQVDYASCTDGGRNTGIAGIFTNDMTVQNVAVDRTQLDAAKTVTVSINQNSGDGRYAANYDQDSRLDADSIDFCDFGDDSNTNVDVIVDHLLDLKAEAQTWQLAGKRWGKADTDKGNWKFSEMASFSSGRTRAPLSDLRKTQFHIEEFDQLDQQCFTRIGVDRREFEEITCEPASHAREFESMNVLGSEEQNNGRMKLNDPNGLLNNLVADDDDTDQDCSTDDAENKRKGCGYKQLATSRYPLQEYCLSVKDKTMFKELFGCSDDQREVCSDNVDKYEPPHTDVNGNHVNNNRCHVNSDLHLSDCECAGGIDEDVINSHVDYLPENWFSNRETYKYGSNANEYKCETFEILIANELSSYLDRHDQDITLACRNAIELLHKSSEAYVDFVNPGALRLDDDSTTENDELYQNIYSVLREAWRQAEFMLRSIKIQEQVRDRMLKYRDWTLRRFDALNAATSNSPGTQILAPRAWGNNLNPDMTDASAAYIEFMSVWNKYIYDYEDLSHNEINALKADLDHILVEVAEAKSMAEELAKSQQAAAAAVATVSLHFRRKLNLWVHLEETLEDAFRNAREETGTGPEGADKHHLNLNYANTEVHEPKSFSFDLQSDDRAKITDGAAYNTLSGRTDTGQEEARMENFFDNEYIEDGTNNQKRTTKFKTSNSEIDTTLPCTVSDKTCAADTYYLTKEGCECDALVFVDDTMPQLDREANCKTNSGSPTGYYCSMKNVVEVADDDVEEVEIEVSKTDTDFDGILNNNAVHDELAIHGGVTKKTSDAGTDQQNTVPYTDGGSLERYNHEQKTESKLTHTIKTISSGPHDITDNP